MLFWKKNNKDKRIDLPSQGHALLHEAQLARRAGDLILAAQLCEQAIQSYRSLLRLRPLDFRSRDGLKRAWHMPLLLFPDPTHFPWPISRLSQRQAAERGPLFKRFCLLFKTWFINHFVEKEWRVQCNGKFGGPKPTGRSWRSFYLENERFLNSNPDYIVQFGWAVEMGHLQLAESLMALYRSEGRIQMTQFPVEEAILNGDEEMVRFFLREGLSPALKRGGDWTLLHYAVSANTQTLCSLLLAHGANPDAKDVSGLTPLFMAILHEDVPMAALLISHGARCHETLANGLTLLAWAVYRKNLPLVELLLKHGTTLTFTHVCGFSLLHVACQFGHLKITEVLLKAGLDPTSVDRFKRTPLHWAAHFGHVDIIEKLCKENATLLTLKDQYNDTALDIAIENRHPKSAKRLRECFRAQKSA